MNARFDDPLIGKPFKPSDAQLYRRLVSSFRHDSRRAPWDDLDWRAFLMANKLDRIRAIKDAKEAAEQRPVDTDDGFERGEWRRGRELDLDIFHGGERP